MKCVALFVVVAISLHIVESAVVKYSSIGCFKDTSNRAIPTLEGSDARLDGSSYTARQNALEKCAAVAADRGFDCFAVQNGGWCASSPIACRTYDKYGSSSACGIDGEGGPYANNVYRINCKRQYKSIGCYKDTSNRAIATLEGTDPRLNGAYSSRANPIEKCAQVANDLGYDYFAVQNGGWCASSADAENTFDKYGHYNSCKTDGEGGGWGNEVYKLI
ncbi:uncharacterized protein LOC144451062 [Glandiceps talaboti]